MLNSFKFFFFISFRCEKESISLTHIFFVLFFGPLLLLCSQEREREREREREVQSQSSYGVVEGTDPEAQESQHIRSILSQKNPRRYRHRGDNASPFSSVLVNLTASVVSTSCDLYESFRDLIQESFVISLIIYCAKQLIRLSVAQNMFG